MTIIKLPSVISDFVLAHKGLAKEWKDTPLKFTLDGRLVGDIAEAIAAKEFDLAFPKRRTPGVDLITKGQIPTTVQVKASGIGKGPAFTPGKGSADRLIFMLLNFENCTAEIIYNGPEAPVREQLPKEFTGTRRVSLKIINELNLQQKSRLARVGK